MFTLAKQVEIGSYLLWVGISLVLIILASLAVLWYRRRLLDPNAADHSAGLLDELRGMKSRGEISEEEFAAAKRSMVARLARSEAPDRKLLPRKGDRIAPPGVDLTGQPLPKPPAEPPKEPPNV